jgi:hypothetical protein
MNNSADNLENLIAKIHKAPLETEMLLGLSETDKHILQLTAELQSIPIATVPVANKKHKFASLNLSAHAHSWSDWLAINKFSLTAFTLLMFVSLSGLFYKTTTALPGQKLFTLKKSAEQFRVKFATTDIQKAYLKVQIAKKRVAEAEKLAQMGNNNPQLELAVMKEISLATNSAVKEIENLPAKSLNSEKKPIIESLADVSEKEQTLISGLTNASKDIDDVITQSLINQTKVSEIKQSVAIATAEEAIASLSKTNGLIAISGEITKLQKNKLNVEKTEFIITDTTEIIDNHGKSLLFSQLSLKNQIAISGKKEKDEIFATKIILANSNVETGEVKGENTGSTSIDNTTTPKTILKLESETTYEPPLVDPNSASVNFIFEDPKPQFTP